MKKSICLLFCIFLSASLFACGKPAGDGGTSTDPEPTASADSAEKSAEPENTEAANSASQEIANDEAPPIDLDAYTLAESEEEKKAYAEWLEKADNEIGDLRLRVGEMGGTDEEQRTYLEEYVSVYSALLEEAQTIPVDEKSVSVHHALIQSLADGILTAEMTLSEIVE